MKLFNSLKVKNMASQPVIEGVREIINFANRMKLSSPTIDREYDKVEQWEKVTLDAMKEDQSWRFVILVFRDALTVTIYRDELEVKHLTDRSELPNVLWELENMDTVA